MAENKTPHGTFCWNECVSTDTTKATKFYTELLGWKAETQDMGDMKYTLLKAGDKMAGGLMAMPETCKGFPSHWMSYIAVDDVDGMIEKITELGGKVAFGPMDIPEVGRFVTIEDPTGAFVSLITLTE